ncbi:MAG TPA: hypothetical protein VF547_12885 [Allosphingosinicella sp.]
MTLRSALAAALALAAPAAAHVPVAQMAPAIYTDPPHDKAHPAAMEVLHIPSGGSGSTASPTKRPAPVRTRCWC